jgi:uncharacterized membrane protein YdbT with pleckstrin-like domain
MAEETVWTGSTSQYKNLGTYVLCIVVALVIPIVCYLFKLPAIILLLVLVPLVYAFWKWLFLKSHSYRLTTERLLTTEGIFSKCTDTLELYRVKDIRMTQSVFERMVGMESVELLSSDLDTPELVLDFVPSSLKLQDKIREQVEACRVQKRTREVDLE